MMKDGNILRLKFGIGSYINEKTFRDRGSRLNDYLICPQSGRTLVALYV